jgi:hypothetical protein
MLNDASIDIDEEPLGDYENGHIGIDDAEDVEEEGGDDELEEVDADTYEDAASKKDHITRRMMVMEPVVVVPAVMLDFCIKTREDGPFLCQKLYAATWR